MKRLVLGVLAVLSLGGCVAYDMDNPALYDDPRRTARQSHDPFFDGPAYEVRYDRFGRPIYVRRDPNAYYGSAYFGGGYGRPDRPHFERFKRRMTIEDAQYESVNGRRIDANRYVRDECDGENNCDVKASNKKFGDPDVGAHKDLIVRYRCGKGPSRTVRVPEKSEQDIRC